MVHSSAAGRSQSSREWNRLLKRKAWLLRRDEHLREHPECVDCSAVGRLAMAVDVHHIVRRERPWESPDDELMSLCRSHHSIRTSRGE